MFFSSSFYGRPQWLNSSLGIFVWFCVFKWILSTGLRAPVMDCHMVPLHHSTCDHGQPCVTHQGLAPALRGSSSLTLEAGGFGSWSSCCYFRKKKKEKNQKAAMCLKEKHLACETVLAPGSVIHQAPSHSEAEPSCWEGKEGKSSAVAQQSCQIPMAWGNHPGALRPQ